MTEKDFYYTIDKPKEVEIKIQRSRFIANIFPITSKDDFSAGLELVKKKYFDARHHPYAYKLGLKDDSYKTNDDGEPTGTSGKPILEAINKYELTDIGGVVTRYFGGIKLGTGGLKRAYFDAADECISNSKIIKKLITKDLLLEMSYEYIGPIMNLIEKSGVEIVENISDESAKLICRVRLSFEADFKEPCKPC